MPATSPRRWPANGGPLGRRMDERTRRIGLNEALFRDVNQRVEALAEGFGLTEERIEVLCECGDQKCMDRIEMTLPAYRHVRADSRTFAVLPGHEQPDVERVVQRQEGFDVVMKHPGEPSRLAEETDRPA